MPTGSLKAEFDAFARKAYGLSGDTLLAKLKKGESGGRHDAVSNAGARGEYQFMPQTREAVRRYTGGRVDPYRSEAEGREAAMLHLLGKLGHKRGLGGYNPGGGKEYVRYILRQQVGDAGSSGSPGGGSASQERSRTVTKSRTIPGEDRSDERRALLLQFLQRRHQPGAVTALAAGLKNAQDTPAATATSTKTVRVPKPSSSRGPSQKGTANFEGKTVAAWMVPVLQYARRKGWKGQVVSGVRSHELQSQLYAEFKAGKRAGPVAVPGTSHHERTEFPGGAIDVTDAATLNRILQAKHSRLKWAGAKDPPHFSVPSGGSY